MHDVARQPVAGFAAQNNARHVAAQEERRPLRHRIRADVHKRQHIALLEGMQLRLADEHIRRLAQAAAQQLRDIGINCTVDIPAQMDWGGQMACLIGWGSPFDADDHTYKVFGTDKGANYSGYSNAAVDSYLKLARETSDPEQRRQYYAKFQEALAADPAYAFICYIDANYVAVDGLQGIAADTVLGHHGVGIFWNVQEWTIEK